jgi:type II secretory pathway pseudopilin PulG
VKAHDRTVTPPERGFSLLEVLVASALTIAVVLVITSAVLGALHATALAAERSALAEDASSALADVRAATGYGVVATGRQAQPLLQKLVGHSATMTRASGAGRTETITVVVAQAAPGAPIVARATASDGSISETERRTLYYEAPTPGSVVDEEAPP